jgi:hypothetical protein
MMMMIMMITPFMKTNEWIYIEPLRTTPYTTYNEYILTKNIENKTGPLIQLKFKYH